MATLGLASASVGQQAVAQLDLRIDAGKWQVVFSESGWTPIDGAPSSKDRKVHSYANEPDMLVLSVIVENAHSTAVIDSCHDVFARRAAGMRAMGLTDEVQSMRGEAALQEYSIPVSPDGTIVQRHVYSCRVRGDFYIDAHVSKMGYQPANYARLMSVLDNVALVPKKPRDR